MRSFLFFLSVLLLLGTPRVTGNLVVNYMAEFTYFRGAFCEGPFPVLMAVCENGGQIELVEDPVPSTVICAPTPASDLPQGASSGLTCTTASCADSTDAVGCAEDWTTSLSLEDGNFAEIHYSCSGDSADQVASYFSFLNSGTGACVECTLDPDSCVWLDGFNFHVARLSVLCPPFESAEDYVNEDTFTECHNTSVSIQEVIQGGPAHAMQCISGTNCGYSACDVEFGDGLVVSATPYSFQQCIQSSTASNVTTPILTESPAEPATNPGTYNAKFSVVFGMFMVDAEWNWLSGGSCYADMPTTTLQIVCSQNGTITFDESTVPSMQCENDGRSTLLCRDSIPLSGEEGGSTYFNALQQITYVSSTDGPAYIYLPQQYPV
jgi:hypothetical protein